MNSDIKSLEIPGLVKELVTDSSVKADNLIADLWKVVNMGRLIKKAGFKKRTGLAMEQVIYLLLVWVWMKVDSIGMFASEVMQCFGLKNKDVLYDQLKREDLNWRKLHYQTAEKVIRETKMHKSPVRAFVVDDSVKERKGKKMEAVSRHFDHLQCRTVKGQQVLTLGLATEEHFMVLDNDIYMSQKGRQGLKAAFKDGRSVAAKRYQDTEQKSKPELLRSMVKRAVKHDIEADYFLADAWFGNKPTIRLAHEVNTVPIVRMKNNKTRYRYVSYQDGQEVRSEYTAQQLYKEVVKKNWKRCGSSSPYQSVSVEVELNLASTDKEPEQWVKTKLLFVRGAAKGEKQTVGKKDWALFLTTDVSLTPQEILEIYALRWGIEVYFKEAKQHMGWLKEQTETFASHIASLHLCAIRYAMLVCAKARDGGRMCDMRKSVEEQLTLLSYGKRLWGLFRLIIEMSLDELKDELDGKIELIMNTLDKNIMRFFTQALQLDHRTLELESKEYEVS